MRDGSRSLTGVARTANFEVAPRRGRSVRRVRRPVRLRGSAPVIGADEAETSENRGFASPGSPLRGRIPRLRETRRLGGSERRVNETSRRAWEGDDSGAVAMEVGIRQGVCNNSPAEPSRLENGAIPTRRPDATPDPRGRGSTSENASDCGEGIAKASRSEASDGADHERSSEDSSERTDEGRRARGFRCASKTASAQPRGKGRVSRRGARLHGGRRSRHRSVPKSSRRRRGSPSRRRRSRSGPRRRETSGRPRPPPTRASESFGTRATSPALRTGSSREAGGHETAAAIDTDRRWRSLGLSQSAGVATGTGRS